MTAGAGRRALREARRQRRRLAVFCAAVIVACLAMTIVVLGMARDRPAPAVPSGTATAGPPAPGTGVAVTEAAAPPSFLPTSPDQPGAAAPEGGTP